MDFILLCRLLEEIATDLMGVHFVLVNFMMVLYQFFAFEIISVWSPHYSAAWNEREGGLR